MAPEDLKRLAGVSDHALSADGSRAVFVVHRVVADRPAAELWLASTSGDLPPRRLTGQHHDVAPSISPDGTRVAFIRRHGTSSQLCICELATGSVTAIAEGGPDLGMAASKRHIRGTSAPQWAPDGSKLAYVDVVREAVPYPGSSAAIIRQHPYQFDGRGPIHDRFLHVFLLDVDRRAAPYRFTTSSADHWDVCWRPDGCAICFASDRDVGDGVRAIALYETTLDPATLEPLQCRRLTDGRCTVNLPSYARDGAHIFFVGIGPFAAAQPDIRARNVSLWRVDVASAAGHPTRISDAEHVDVDERRTRPLIVGTGGEVLLSVRARGAVELGEMTADGWMPIVRGRCQVSSYDRANGVTTAVIADATNAGDLFVVVDGTPRALTHERDGYADIPRRAPIDVETHAADGYPVHGWVLLPPGRGPHPLLLLIHGGPDTQWGYSLNEEAQAYASAGYAVLLPNPRGSAGYGESHASVLNGHLGSVDVEDVLALLDATSERHDIDRRRVGVLGRSYGGFLTAWLAAFHGDRFRAAVGECGIYDWQSALATSDIGWQLSAMVGETEEQWSALSPLRFSRRISMPFLVMHYLSDLRIPFEQGQRLFAALRRAGTPTELVQFAGGPHTFADTGPVADRIARLRIIIDWFGRWLDAADNRTPPVSRRSS